MESKRACEQSHVLFVPATAKVDGSHQQVGIGEFAIGAPDQLVCNGFGINQPALRVGEPRESDDAAGGRA